MAEKPHAMGEDSERESSCARRADERLRERAWPLAVEHELLRAQAGALRDGTPFVERYGEGDGEWNAPIEGCALADMSDLSSILIGGEGARSFASTVFSAAAPMPGSCAFALALSGDGTVIAPALIGGIDAEDFIVWVPGGLAEGLRAWLEAMRALKGMPAEDGSRESLWPEVELDDPVSGLVTLAIEGPEARVVLDDYLADDTELPRAGALARLELDRIVTTCVGLPWPEDAWLVILPSPAAPVIWRSLLSFPQVTPVGTPVIWGRLVEDREGLKAYLEAPIRPFAPKELGLEGLLRPEGGFIGARALGIGA